MSPQEAPPPPGYWAQILALKQLTPATFTTVQTPQGMGNALPIAYGGFALAAAVKAASYTLPPTTATQPQYHLYSISGHYLGPSSLTSPLLISVRIVRQTRTFATRYIEVSQKQADDSVRVVLVALADFQVAEPESLLEYSAPPTREYTHYSALPSSATQAQALVTSGKVSQKLVDAQQRAFGLFARLFDNRPCPEGIFAQVLTGLAKHLATTQDELPITEKSTADWYRSHEDVGDQTENVALLAFLLDGALAFAPLTFSHLFLEDSGAASSLDFSLRVFSNEVRMREWQQREIVTIAAANGRSHSESRVWDAEGKMVASMTQTSILRPRKKREERGKL